RAVGTVARQPGIDFELHAWPAAGAALGDLGELFGTRGGHLDTGIDYFVPGDVRGCQPAQDRAGQTVGAQRHRLFGGGRTEPGGTGVLGGTRDRHDAVTVTIGLHYGHQPGAARDGTQGTQIAPVGVQIDDGLYTAHARSLMLTR